MEQQPLTVAEPTAAEIRVRDPLTPVTRKERLYLLAVSMIGIAMVRTGLVPSKIATFGIELDRPNRSALLFLLALVTIYFLVAFLIYAASDYLTRREALGGAYKRHETQRRFQAVANRLQTSEEHIIRLYSEGELRNFAQEFYRSNLSKGDEETARERTEVTLRILDDPRFGLEVAAMEGFPPLRATSSDRIGLARVFFEFLLPLLVGGYAIFSLLTRSLT